MRKNIHLLFVLTILISICSCSLDITPSNEYTEDIIWKDADNIDLYINELYSTFRIFQFGAMSNYIGDGNATDALTDIMKYTSVTPGKGTVNELATNPSTISPATPAMNYWGDGYARIRRINEFIEGIDKNASYLDEERKLQYVAEAHFIRGYVYFWLAKLHGSIIIINDIGDYGVIDRERLSEEKCWNAIADDFIFAAQELPISWGTKGKGKATKVAAYGMLARTWLYAASVAKYDRKQFNSDPLTGIQESKANELFQNAATAAKEAMSLSEEAGIGLEESFDKIFTNDSKETVFASYFVPPMVRNVFDIMYAPPGDNKDNKCWVRGVPTSELVDEFEMKDGTKFDWNNPVMAENPYENREPRFYSTILYNEAVWKGRTVITATGNELEGYVEYGNNLNADEPKRTVTGYYIRKMLDSDNTTFVDEGSFKPWIEMRYAELLLIAAEAEAQLGGTHQTAAMKYLNTLRVKRGLPEYHENDLMKAIKHERIVELAFEGHRYWDLRRWREAHVVLNDTRFHACKITESEGGYRYEIVPCDDRDRKFYPSLYYMPIPSTEIRNNQSISQIKGW